MSADKQPSTGDDSSETPTLPIQLAPPPGRVRVRLDIGSMTHVGKVRPNNEDQFLTARATKALEVLSSSLPGDDHSVHSEVEGFLFLVADGMGGHAGGERASAFVVEELKRYALRSAKWFFRLDDPDEQIRLRLLREELERIDEKLINVAREDPSLRGMGTTMTAACSLGAEVFLVAVGDSRAYLFCEGALHQLTIDQTLAQELVDKGELSPTEARKHRGGKILTNALGGTPGVKAEVAKLRVADGDRLLLCTDGLSDMVDDARIADILSRHSRADDACRALVEAALSSGGRDNVTVIVVAYAIESV